MSPRMTRKETVQKTRSRLLAAAETLFAARGYTGTSLDAIAAEAGYTKGAVYANFSGKETMFLEVLGTIARRDLDRLIAAIGVAQGRREVEALLIDWAGERAKSGSWPLTLIEFVRQKRDDTEVIDQLTGILQANWRALGAVVVGPLGLSEPPLLVGAALHEIAYAPAMTIVSDPSASDLMRLFLAARHQISRPDPGCPAA